MDDASNMQRSDCEVLVVGAGPTGLAAALALRTQGVRVAIVDEAPERHREARASAVHARTLEFLAPHSKSVQVRREARAALAALAQTALH